MSTTNFSSLGLDNFTQLLDTSSVIIGLEFVFSNLCWTISENLLFLSFQKNPDLLIFRKFTNPHLSSSLSFCTAYPSQFFAFLRAFYTIFLTSSVSHFQFIAQPTLSLLSLISRLIQFHPLGLEMDFRFVRSFICERVVLGKTAMVLISERAQGICPPHRGR